MCLVAQLCPTLCNPMGTVAQQALLYMGILQVRILEWVALLPTGTVPLGGGTEPRQHPAFPLLEGGSPAAGAPVLCSQHQEPEGSPAVVWLQSETSTMDTSPGGEARQGCVLCPSMNLV